MTLFCINIAAQSSCSLGDLVFEENFGTGTSRLGPSLNQDRNNVHPNFRPADLYTYVGAGSIGQDQYGIIKNGKDAAPEGASWNDDFRDHTGNLNGYMYYCDAKEDLNVFYAQKITGLCSEIEYELSAWFAKSNAPDYYIDPNVKLIVGFTDANDNNLGVVESNTGSIEGVGSFRWHRKALVFTVPINTDNIYFMLKNNVAGVAGNDLAIDDIQIRPCGPEVEILDVFTNSVISDVKPICISDLNNLNISITSDILSNYVVQWQESMNDGNWVDIPNKTSVSLDYNLTSTIASHKLRLKFAHNQINLVNSKCNFFSKEIEYRRVFANQVSGLKSCDDAVDGDDSNGIVQNFDLESLSESILGTEQSSTDFMVTYYRSQVDAIAGDNNLVSPHSNSLSPYVEEIFVRVEDLITGCVNSSLSFNLEVDPLPKVFTVKDITTCDDDIDGDPSNGIVQSFNLEDQSDTILGPTQSAADFKVTYHLSSIDAISGDDPLTSPHSNNLSPFVEQIFVRVEDLSTSCVNSNLSFSVVVNPLPISNLVDAIEICDDDIDGDDTNGIVQNFDLESKTDGILGVSQLKDDYVVSYHLSATDAISGADILTSPHSNQLSPFQQTIYVRVEDKSTGCVKTGLSFDLVVNSLPVVSSLVELKQCDADVDGFSAFNLYEVNAEISSDMINETFSYHTSYDDASNGVNAILDPTVFINQKVTSDKVWARVLSIDGCARISEIELIVSTTGIPSDFHREFNVCDDFIDEINNDGDGISTFNFNSIDVEVRAIFPPNQLLNITYFRNEVEALAEVNAIEDISNYRNIGYPNSQEIYIRVDSALNNDCLGFGAHITLNVETIPEFEVKTQRIICDSGSSSTITLEFEQQNQNELYDYQWTDENGKFMSSDVELEVSQSGSYFITLFKTDGLGCSKEKEIEVVFSETANIGLNDIEIVDDSNNNAIYINNKNNNLGEGDYEFSLDNPDFGFQNEPYFEHVSPGIHTIFVRDKNGCDATQIEVSVIGYPKFFTPNNDGQNDTWKVLGVNNELYSKAVMYIFDRFGKIIAKMDPRIDSWNGMYNGVLLQANDYWFSSELEDAQGVVSVKKGHFSLIRR